MMREPYFLARRHRWARVGPSGWWTTVNKAPKTTQKIVLYCFFINKSQTQCRVVPGPIPPFAHLCRSYRGTFLSMVYTTICPFAAASDHGSCSIIIASVRSGARGGQKGSDGALNNARLRGQKFSFLKKKHLVIRTLSYNQRNVMSRIVFQIPCYLLVCGGLKVLAGYFFYREQWLC